MEIPKVIKFDGRKYWIDGKGRYYGRISAFEGKMRWFGLHRAVWEFHNKRSVPKGWHVHHIDGNTHNNDISNLECLSADEHNRIPKNIDREAVRRHLASIRPLATKWHRSKDGREWHKKNATESARVRVPKRRRCDSCGVEYEFFYSSSRFCSSRCLQRNISKKRTLYEKRTCSVCSREFECRKYLQTKCCSQPCAARSGWKRRR